MVIKKILAIFMAIAFLAAFVTLDWAIYYVLAHYGMPGLGGFIAGMVAPWLGYRYLSWFLFAFTNVKVKMKWGMFPYI